MEAKRASDAPIIISISGPSGVGKGTVINRVLPKLLSPYLSISCTSRKPRGEECDGVEYYFVTQDRFKQMLDEGDILEHDTFVGEFYGTPRRPIEEHLATGSDIMLDITVLGAINVKKALPQTATIFLAPPSISELEKRLRERGTETEEKIQNRLAQASSEFHQAEKFDYIVVNDDLEQCVEDVMSIVLAERMKANRNRSFVQELIVDSERYTEILAENA